MTGFLDLYVKQSQKDGLSLPVPAIVETIEKMACCTHCAFHRHNFYQVGWVAHHNVTLACDFVTYDLPQGTIAFITPGQIHRWTNSVLDPNNLLIFSFKPDLFMRNGIDIYQALAGIPFHNPTMQPFIATTTRANLINALFVESVNIFRTGSKNTDDLLSSYLRLILAEVRSLGMVSDETPLSASQYLLRQFYEALQQYFTQRLQVQDYATMLGVTSSHLVETIRQTTGFTPGQLLHNQLLLEAKRLLVYSNQSIAEIADQLSFQTTSHFGQWFRKNEGITPGEFRREF